MTAAELLSAGLEALARADAEELARLAEAARETPVPATPAEQRIVLQRYRALGKLLRLTRRNLRLLRGEYGEPFGYGAPLD